MGDVSVHSKDLGEVVQLGECATRLQAHLSLVRVVKGEGEKPEESRFSLAAVADVLAYIPGLEIPFTGIKFEVRRGLGRFTNLPLGLLGLQESETLNAVFSNYVTKQGAARRLHSVIGSHVRWLEGERTPLLNLALPGDYKTDDEKDVAASAASDAEDGKDNKKKKDDGRKDWPKLFAFYEPLLQHMIGLVFSSELKDEESPPADLADEVRNQGHEAEHLTA